MKGSRVSSLLLAYRIGMFLIPAFWITDWVIYPEHVLLLGMMRLFTAAFLYAASLVIPHVRPSMAVGVTAGSFVLVSMVFTLMCALTGDGLGSPYYAGTMLVILTASVLLEWRPYQFNLTTLSILVVHFGILAPLPASAADWTVNVFFLGGAVLLGMLLNNTVNRVRAKNEYLLKVFAHDMKNQLAALLTNLKWLGLSHTPEKGSLFESNLKKAHLMTGNLLNVFGSEETDFQLNLAPQDLSVTAAALLKDWTPFFHARGIQVEGEWPPVDSVLDRDYMRLVWDNLMANALDHTPRGGKLRLGSRESSAEGLTLFIGNTGEGIAPGEAKHLFTMENPGRRSSAYKKGLGLPYSALMVKAHGGHIHYLREDPWNYFMLSLPRSAANLRTGTR